MDLSEEEWEKIFANWVASSGAKKLSSGEAQWIASLIQKYVQDERQVSLFGGSVGGLNNLTELAKCSLDSYELIAEVSRQWGRHLNIWETAGKEPHPTYESLLAISPHGTAPKYIKVQLIFKKSSSKIYQNLSRIAVNLHKDEKSENHTDHETIGLKRKDSHGAKEKKRTKKGKTHTKKKC